MGVVFAEIKRAKSIVQQDFPAYWSRTILCLNTSYMDINHEIKNKNMVIAFTVHPGKVWHAVYVHVRSEISLNCNFGIHFV